MESPHFQVDGHFNQKKQTTVGQCSTRILIFGLGCCMVLVLPFSAVCQRPMTVRDWSIYCGGKILAYRKLFWGFFLYGFLRANGCKPGWANHTCFLFFSCSIPVSKAPFCVICRMVWSLERSSCSGWWTDMPTVLVAQLCHVAVEFSTRTFLQSEFQDSNQDGQISREEYSPEENACGHLTFFCFACYLNWAFWAVQGLLRQWVRQGKQVSPPPFQEPCGHVATVCETSGRSGKSCDFDQYSEQICARSKARTPPYLDAKIACACFSIDFPKLQFRNSLQCCTWHCRICQHPREQFNSVSLKIIIYWAVVTYNN